MTQLLFLRHGATAGNLEKRYIGRTDEPLCPAGLSQARALKARCPRVQQLYVSPMLRARQTAALLFPGTPCVLVEDFAETHFGRFEGKTARELADDPAYRAWVASRCRAPISGGEDPERFQARCREAFLRLLPSLPDGGRAAFVVHGGTIMAILAGCARPRRDFYAYHIPPGQALVCRWDGTLRVLSAL